MIDAALAAIAGELVWARGDVRSGARLAFDVGKVRKFDNPLRDPRNVDNIVAKRGALFMVDLKHFVQEKGYTVAHIKTDSIKIPNADDHIISEVHIADDGFKGGDVFRRLVFL